MSQIENAIPISRDIDLARSRAILRDRFRSINWRDLARLTRLSGSSQRRITHVWYLTTLQEEFEKTLRACKRPFLRISTSTERLESLIENEIVLYECGGTRGQFLQFAYNSLLTLVPTGVESERAFSAAGYIATEITFVGQLHQ